MVARHPQRPYTLDYINGLFSDFRELHGDRQYADDPAIVGGLARFNGKPCMVLGHQKGRDTKEKIFRNFGMPRPEGYRKALRLMKLAEKFGLPLFTFVDTPGAYPGIGAEERGQSEAIGRNLYEMAGLRVPIIVTVVGEGGSGGALAIAIGDVTLMLQYATYSVISPEGCASILWKSAEQAPEAAETLGITAPRLKQLGLIDKVLNEPLGGAHRDPAAMMVTLKKALTEALRAPQGSAARHAARDARGQDPVLRQVQGDPRRLIPPAGRSFRGLRDAGLIRGPPSTGAARRARSVRRGRCDAQRCKRRCASRSRCRAGATRWCSSTPSGVSRRIFRCALSATHVHHGLSKEADAWATFCDTRMRRRAACRSRCIACTSRAPAARASGHRPHGALCGARDRRRGRHCARASRRRPGGDAAPAAFARRGAGRPCGHADVPVAGRGASAAAAAACRCRAPRSTRMLAPPVSEWVDDESNADTGVKRNFIRRDIAPRLAAAFPGYPATLARAAARRPRRRGSMTISRASMARMPWGPMPISG